MKKNIEKYCNKIQRQTGKLLYKLFGKKESVKYYFQIKKQLKCILETEARKPIEEITTNDFKNNAFLYTLSKYKTLEKVLNIYTETSCLSLSNMEDR